MALFGKSFSRRPSAPARRPVAPKPLLGKEKPASVIRRPSPPTRRPSPPKTLFGKEKHVPVKRLFWEARKPVVIPGTGGKLMSGRQHQELLKRLLPHKKIGSRLTESEAKRVLRQLRKEDRGGRPSRERRVIEKEWGLKA